MDIKNWQRIEELFHNASQLQGAARTDFLASECHGDDRLLNEINSLIGASERDGLFFEQPTFDLGIRILGQTGSLAGQTIGHYQILRLLGEGGMGEVYLAQDTMLDRKVALKFLVTGLFDDHSAKDQLMREARAVAKLEHPNICAVYGLESFGKHYFIVMPYIEGETLDSIWRESPPDLDRALDLTEQIASALAAAHLQGIIHRDVKPQNILIDKTGQAKVLDFGLAKLAARAHNPAMWDNGSTASQAGIVPGTVAYMSPEQTRADKLECATDVFSFGIVMHEMLNGQHPFMRESRAETIAAIAHDDPPPLPDMLPAKLKQITRKCLQKSAVLRYATGEELLVDLRQWQAERKRVAATAWQRKLRFFSIAVAVMIVVLSAAGAVLWRKATRVHTLAILPIVNESGDPNNNYMSVGLTRTLFDKLSGLPRLKVKLPTVIPAGAGDPTVRVGRDLHVEAVLSGKLVNENGNLRLRLQLIETADGKSNWQQTFDARSLDVFAVQESVGTNVTSRLGMWLMGADRKLLARHETESQEALSAYMQGRHYYSFRDAVNLQTAIKYFDRAISLDSSFGEAYAGRADCSVLMPNVLYGPQPANVVMERAIDDARRAIEINPTIAEAHTSMGIVNLRYYWNWQVAEAEFRTAIELQPDYAPAHFWYVNLLVLERRFDESIREAETARSLDPYAPISALNYGRALYYARRYDEAEAFLSNSLANNPANEQFMHQLVYVWIQQGRFDKAVDVLKKIYVTNPLYAAAPLGYVYAKLGQKSEAESMLEFLDKSTTPKKPNPAHEKAIIYIGLRDWDAAFSYLDKSYNERFASVPFVIVDPLYDELRPDSRFAALAERVHLEP